MARSIKAELKSLTTGISYQRVAMVATIFVVIGATFYHFVEDFRWVDSFYFTFITLATVGYGDFAPHTDIGKIFTMFYVLFGISIFLVLAKLVLAGTALRINRRKTQK